MIQYIILFSIIQTFIHANFIGDGTAYTLGSIESGNCNFMFSGFINASTNYAAINNEQWDGLRNCGRCARVQCVDQRCTNKQSAIVQILDRCPECKFGDLDLSPSIFKELTGSDPSRYKIQWEFIRCPITGNIKYCFNRGSNNYWTAIQPTNFADGIYKMKINNMDTSITPDAYYYLSNKQWINTSDVDIELTDINGYIINDRLSLSIGSCTDGSMQFPISNNSDTQSLTFDDLDC